MHDSIFAEITGTRKAERVLSTSFHSLDELRACCLQQKNACLVIIQPDEVDAVTSWLPDKHVVCLTTDPASLIARRSAKLSLPNPNCFDTLTKLITRHALAHAIEYLPHHFPDEQSVSLVLCDLDHFKTHNDSYGHQAGDELLVRTADILTGACDANDIASRFGGEEFAILTTRPSMDVPEWIENIRQTIEHECYDRELTASFGIANSTVGLVRLDEGTLYRQADEALYAAKANGRNCFVQFDQNRANTSDHAFANLENRSRVLSERVTNFITLHSKKIVARVRAEADTDALTSFYTRRYFDRRFDQEAREATGQMCVAFIDLDHFGNVNKQQGWPTGDKILREVCEIIRSKIRESDWVGRYGGEEFCIVMNETQLREAVVVLERIREAVEQHQFLSTANEAVPMTLSIGAVELTDCEDPLELLERASSQALRAKRGGRNQIAFETTVPQQWPG